MTSPVNGRGALLALYRDIMRVHRQALPPPMRALGDRYIRDEFRRHKEGDTTEPQWRAFAAEWRHYIITLRGSGAEVSGDIGHDVVERLTAEQKQQLMRLQDEAHKLGTSLKDPPP